MTTKLLMIEDDAATVMLLKRYLRRSEWQPEFIHFGYGTDAIDYFASNTDTDAVLLLDLNLPDMAGIDILRHIRGHDVFSSLPVIVLTTSNLGHERKECLELGVEHFLEKPFDYDKLIDILRALEINFA